MERMKRTTILLFGAVLLLAAILLQIRKTALDVRVAAHVEADTILACETTSCKVYVENEGSGKAHIYLRVTMPFFEDAPMDSESPPHNPLFVYDPQPPWRLIQEEVKEDTIESVYYYGTLGTGSTSYFITNWTFNNFAVRSGQCGPYTLRDLYDAVDRIKIEGVGVATIKVPEEVR